MSSKLMSSSLRAWLLGSGLACLSVFLSDFLMDSTAWLAYSGIVLMLASAETISG